MYVDWAGDAGPFEQPLEAILLESSWLEKSSKQGEVKNHWVQALT